MVDLSGSSYFKDETGLHDGRDYEIYLSERKLTTKYVCCLRFGERKNNVNKPKVWKLRRNKNLKRWTGEWGDILKIEWWQGTRTYIRVCICECVYYLPMYAYIVLNIRIYANQHIRLIRDNGRKRKKNIIFIVSSN